MAPGFGPCPTNKALKPTQTRTCHHPPTTAPTTKQGAHHLVPHTQAPPAPACHASLPRLASLTGRAQSHLGPPPAERRRPARRAGPALLPPCWFSALKFWHLELQVCGSAHRCMYWPECALCACVLPTVHFAPLCPLAPRALPTCAAPTRLHTCLPAPPYRFPGAVPARPQMGRRISLLHLPARVPKRPPRLSSPAGGCGHCLTPAEFVSTPRAAPIYELESSPLAA